MRIGMNKGNSCAGLCLYKMAGGNPLVVPEPPSSSTNKNKLLLHIFYKLSRPDPFHCHILFLSQNAEHNMKRPSTVAGATLGSTSGLCGRAQTAGPATPEATLSISVAASWSSVSLSSTQFDVSYAHWASHLSLSLLLLATACKRQVCVRARADPHGATSLFMFYCWICFSGRDRSVSLRLPVDGSGILLLAPHELRAQGWGRGKLASTCGSSKSAGFPLIWQGARRVRRAQRVAGVLGKPTPGPSCLFFILVASAISRSLRALAPSLDTALLSYPVSKRSQTTSTWAFLSARRHMRRHWRRQRKLHVSLVRNPESRHNILTEGGIQQSRIASPRVAKHAGLPAISQVLLSSLHTVFSPTYCILLLLLQLQFRCYTTTHVTHVTTHDVISQGAAQLLVILCPRPSASITIPQWDIRSWYSGWLWRMWVTMPRVITLLSFSPGLFSASLRSTAPCKATQIIVTSIDLETFRDRRCLEKW